MPETGFCQCGCGKRTKVNTDNRPLRNIIRGQYQRYIKGHRLSRFRIPPERYREVKTFYESGLTLRQVANKFNCSHEVICRILKYLKVKRRPRNSFKKGQPISEELRSRLRKRIGEKNPFWKGDRVTIGPLHRWVKRHKPKSDICERCKKEPTDDLANISGKYLRDVSDYEWLCRKCHMKDDGRLERFRLSRVKDAPHGKGKAPEPHKAELPG